MKFVTAVFLLPCLAAADLDSLIPELTNRIPRRARQALSGSDFAKRIATLGPRQREQAILNEVLEGNLPPFLRNLVPVELHTQTLRATIFVTPEYLTVGSDADNLRIPMNFETATAIVDRLGFVLPTKKIVDAIYNQSSFHFAPEPLPAGPQMRSTEYYQRHNQMIESQAHVRGIPEGPLVAGHKKDVVMSNLLAKVQGRIAIYGWHRLNGAPIQPLSTVHGACYADYSHGIRLVSSTVLVNGKRRSISEVLQDPALAPVLSDEGPIHDVWNTGPRQAEQLECGQKAEFAPSRIGFEAPALP